MMRKNVEEWSSVVTYSLTSFLDLVVENGFCSYFFGFMFLLGGFCFGNLILGSLFLGIKKRN